MQAAREMAAALGALAAYLATVLPRTRKELRRWRKLAAAIPDPERRRQALAAIDEKGSNVEAVAVFATLAPRRRRRAAVRAIVPLQVAIDYLDTLEEAGEDGSGDAYLAALKTGWVREIEALPGCGAVVALLRRAVERCGEGQRQTHAAAAAGDSAALQRWAEGLDPSGGYRWWELAAGASSSVAAHALIAAAADARTSSGDAALVDRAYNPSIGALTVLLDDLIDRKQDRAEGEHNYLDHYESMDEARERLTWIAGRAATAIEHLPHAPRHAAILAGVGAFYLSAAEAGAEFAGPLLRASGPGAWLLTIVMRLRRR